MITTGIVVGTLMYAGDKCNTSTSIDAVVDTYQTTQEMYEQAEDSPLVEALETVSDYMMRALDYVQQLK